MKNFEKNYKSLLNKIKLSQEEANKIKNSIIVSKNNSSFKLRYVFMIMLALFIVGTTVVYGKDLINLYTEYMVKKVTYKNEDGSSNSQYEGYFRDYIEISNPNPYSDDDIGKYFTYDEIERTLGIKILKNPMLEEGSFELFKLEYNGENQISHINFSSERNISEMSYSFSFYTQYATDKQREEAYFKVGEEREPVMYHIKSLNVDAYIIAITMDGVDTNYYMTYARSSFPYNGIMYGVTLSKFGYEIEDFYPIFESLSY